jgi:uncharacterized tellurite resistance protein B-like protein
VTQGLASIKRFWEEHIAGGRAAAAPQRPHALRLAAAALLFEVVQADARVSDEERTVMRAGIQGTFGLTPAETDELMRLAEEESRNASSIYEFTALVDKGFTAEEKKRIVELLWLVAFADDEKHALEEHTIRKIAGLLHLPHPDFIDAKLRARAGKSA